MDFRFIADTITLLLRITVNLLNTLDSADLEDKDARFIAKGKAEVILNEINTTIEVLNNELQKMNQPQEPTVLKDEDIPTIPAEALSSLGISAEDIKNSLENQKEEENLGVIAEA